MYFINHKYNSIYFRFGNIFLTFATDFVLIPNKITTFILLSFIIICTLFVLEITDK